MSAEAILTFPFVEPPEQDCSEGKCRKRACKNVGRKNIEVIAAILRMVAISDHAYPPGDDQ